MKKYMGLIAGFVAFVVTVVVSLLGQQSGLPLQPDMIDNAQPGTASLIIQEAMKNSNGAFVMSNPALGKASGIIFAKPFSGNFWGFVLSSRDPRDFLNILRGYSGGQTANNETFNAFIAYVEQLGYKRVVDRSVLPGWLIKFGPVAHIAYNTYANTATFVSTAESFFIVVPLSVFDVGMEDN